MIERTVYQREHCKTFKRTPKIYYTKDRMYYHEKSCFYNIESKTCFTCKHKNRQYNKINQLSIGCNLDLLKSEVGQTLTTHIMNNCDKWEYVYDAEEEEICED